MRLFFPFSDDDVFISYSRRDENEVGERYAVNLYEELKKRGFSSFLDRLGTEPSATQPESLNRKIRNSKMLIIVGTERACQSVFVEAEIKEFLKARRIPVVPIDFNGTIPKARWYPLVEGVTMELEPTETLESGIPSNDVIARIEEAFKYTKRNDQLRKATIGTFIVLIILVLTGIGASGFAVWQLNEAKKAQKEAVNSQNLANTAKKDAVNAQNEANVAKTDADNSKIEATKQSEKAEEEKIKAQKAEKLADEKNQLALAKTKLADEKTKLADLETKRANEETQKAEQAKIETEAAKNQEVIAKAEAGKQQKIGTALQLANNSQSLLKREPEKIIESISLAKDSMQIMNELGIPLLESDTALRESLALLPNFQDKITFNENVKISALSPNGKFLAVLTKENQVNIYENSIPMKRVKSISSELIGEGTDNIAVSNDVNYFATSSGRSVRRFCLNCEIKYQDFRVTSSPKGDEKVEDQISALTISPDGNYIAVLLIYFDELGGELATGNSATIGFWKADKQSEMIEFGDELGMSMRSIAFSASGYMLAVGGVKSSGFNVKSGSVAIWDLSNLNSDTMAENYFISPTIRQVDDGTVTAIAVSSNDTYATVSDKMTSVWKLDPLNSISIPLARIPEASGINNISLDVSGKKLIIKSVKLDVNSNLSRIDLEIWDSQGYQDVLQNELDSKITNLLFGRDKNSLIVSDENNTLNIWDLKNGTKKTFDTNDNIENNESISATREQEYLSWIKPNDKPTSIVSSLDGKYVGVGFSNGTLRVFEVNSKIEVLRLQNDGNISLIAFDQNNKYVALAVEKKTPNGLDDRHLLRVILLQPKNLIIEAENRLNKLPKKN